MFLRQRSPWRHGSVASAVLNRMESSAACERPSDAEARPLSPDALVASYASSVLRFAYMVSPPGMDPEDVAQEAMITALARLDKFDPSRGSVDAWLWRIVVSRAQDAGRAARRRELLVERIRLLGTRPGTHQACPEVLAMNRLTDERLLAAVRRLPRRYRTVIALRYGAGLSGPEAAWTLGVSRMAVVKATRRALDRLRNELEEWSQ